MIYRWTAILYMGTRGFLMALKKIDSEYARIRLIWMAQANKQWGTEGYVRHAQRTVL